MTNERPFQTWTFDSPCDTMEWNPDSNVKLVVGDDADADLVLVGVFAPAKDEDAEEEEEIGEILLEGSALELDGKLGGLLKDLAAENGKEFKNGAEAGGVTPAGRVVDGGKVSLLISVSVYENHKFMSGFQVMGEMHKPMLSVHL